MEEEEVYKSSHVLLIPFPGQGHINPMLQFSKRLYSKGVKPTLAITLFVSKFINPESITSVHIDTISDGCDEGGYAQASSGQEYIQRLQTVGSKTLSELIMKHNQSSSDHPFSYIVYDSALPWAVDVAKRFLLKAAPFYTQMCGVNYIYYNFCQEMLNPHSCLMGPVSIPGLPLLQLGDLPSFFSPQEESYAAYLQGALTQFSNLDEVDCVLVNSFYNLEEEVVDSMSKFCQLLTIGPTIPSTYMDKRIEQDKAYDLNLFHSDSSTSINWLNTNPPGSVVYVSFGTVACVTSSQMEEIAWGLKQTGYNFLWVVRATEEQKLPMEFKQETRNKGLIVRWSPQLEVLSNKAVGCFLTHCGWNSTIEALSLGVPMVAMPQWTDQTTNGKFVSDIWKVGVRVKNGDGIVSREEIGSCIRQVMEGERGKEMKENAMKLSDFAIKAVCKGGSSDKNIDEFISKLT